MALPPVFDEPGPGLLGGGGGVDAAVLLVGGDGLGGAAVGDVVERAPFPRLRLALVVDQLDGEPAGDQGAERAAGFDLGQLAVIADQHQLAVRSFDVLEQLGQLPGRDHAGLVDDEHAPVRERPAVVDVVQQRGGAGRFDPGPRSQLAGGAAGDSHAEHRMAGLLPRLAGRREREGLARPGLAGHDDDSRGGVADVLDHPLLLLGKGRPSADGRCDVRLGGLRRRLRLAGWWRGR